MPRDKLRRTVTVYDIIDVILVTMKVMDDRSGYVSKNNATATGEVPTATFVINHLKNHDKVSEEIKMDYGVLAKEVYDYFKMPPRDPSDAFLSQVYSLMVTSKVSEKSIAFIVALPWLYENIHNRTIKLLKIAEKYTSSNYMGELGVRGTFIVKLLDVSEFKKQDPAGGQESHFWIYRIADPVGNFGIFFSKFPPFDGSLNLLDCLPIKLWDCFEMLATPKKMQPNRETGIKETQFSNVELTEIIGEGTEE